MARCLRSKEERADQWSVCVYLVELAFGGPEEGGWWYEVGYPVGKQQFLFADEDDACAAANRLGDLLDGPVGPNRGRRPMHSVASDGVYRAHVAFGQPVEFPEVTPHYE